ncbi:MAG TPA: BMP family ABC transporter substrate-binding protein [Oscillospiraceae bacterium]|nr:BMP family ABC transporter substrate-binding protein [Oscillospiraceae bacterium]
MKKLFALILALVMVFALAACGGTTEEESAPEESEAVSEEPSSETEQPAEPLKIAVVSSPSGVDDGNFNQNIYEGIVKFCEDNGNATVTPVQETTGDTSAALQAVADIVADYPVIVCNGFQFAGIGTIAAENPDTTFILIDSFPTDATGTEVTLDNVYACQYLEQEGGFLAGVAAAMTTVSGKVASVHGVAYPSNVNYQYGFESGVNYANAHYGTTAEVVEIAAYGSSDVTGTAVGGNYVGSFADPATGKVIGEALIAEGCDVLFAAAGGSGNGVLTACKEASLWFIGCDCDQYDDGVNGDTNVVLTSCLKRMDTTVYDRLNDYVNGTLTGQNVYLSAAEGYTGIVTADGRQQLSAEALTALDECFSKIASGEIIPASNFNGYTPEEFPGL